MNNKERIARQKQLVLLYQSRIKTHMIGIEEAEKAMAQSCKLIKLMEEQDNA